MAVTISPGQISDPTNGFRSIVFRNAGSAALNMASSDGSITARVDHVSLTAGARLAAQSADHKQGAANAAEAGSLLRVADQALDEIDSRLARMQELAADASLTALSTDRPAPNLVSDQDRAVMNVEFAALRTEIDNIVRDTKFNGANVLDGFSVTFTVGGGAQSGDSITITLAAADSASLAAGLDTASISTLAGATAGLADVNTAIGTLGNISTSVQGAQESFVSAANGLSFTASVADGERAVRLTPEVTLDVSIFAASRSLDAQGIDEATAALSLGRDLLNSFIVEKAPSRTSDFEETGSVDPSSNSNAIRQNKSSLSEARPGRDPPPAETRKQPPSVSITV